MASKVSGVIEYVQPGGSSGTKYAIAATAYGVCDTAANETIKNVDMTGFKLEEGMTVHIKFTNANSASNPKLKFNSEENTYAKPIVQYGTTAAGTTEETNGWYAGAVLTLTYDGTSWVRDQGFNSSGITSVTIGATSPVQSSTSTAQNGSSASTTISLKDAYGDTKNPYGAKAKNLVLAGPSSGNNAAPSFRALVAADIPNSILKWQTTTAESTALYDFGVYVNMNNANSSSMTSGNYFNILNVPYRKASGNAKADWGWQLGNTTSNDGRLWYRTSGDNVWGDWQTIAHATQSTSDTGSSSQPVYMTKTGVITAITAVGAAYGGTGKTTLKESANVLINALDTGSSDLTANDYVITQYVGGGTTTTTYHRRPASQVVNGTLVKAALGTVSTTAKKFLKDTGSWTQVAFSDLTGTVTNTQLANSSLTVGNKSISLGSSGTVHDILKTSTNIGTDTSWDQYDSGVYYVASNATFTGTSNPENANTNNGISPYRYGQLIVSRAGTGGVAQFYISHNDSNSASYGIHYRTGWNSTYVDKWSVLLDSYNYTQYTVKKDGTGASGSWGISITGTAAKATADASGNTITSTYATKTEVNGLLAAANAMTFKSVINATDALPNSHNAGDTYRVGTAGTYPIVDSNGRYCEVGTLIICITDGTAANAAHWTAVETNEDGAVIGPASSTTNQIAKFSSGTGRVITNSGVSIDDSNNLTVPGTALKITNTSGAKFILMGNQDSSGTDKPTILEAANGTLYIGNGTDWSANNGGTLSTALYMAADRKIGIGTTSPDTLLTVNGNAKADTFIGDLQGNADTATSANRLSQTAITSLSSFTHTTDLIYAAAGGSNSVTDKPSGVDAFGILSYKTADGWYGQILTSSNTSSGIYWRTGTTLSGGWKKLLDSNNTAAGTNNAATLTWNTTYTIAKINGTDIKFTTMTKPTYSDVGAAPAVDGGYLPCSGGTMTGALNLKADLNLYTSSADSPDIVWWYADKGKEQARIWMGSGGATKWAPSYRCYKSDGTSLYSGNLVLGDGTGASGTWGINISGSAGSVAWANITDKPISLASIAYGTTGWKQLGGRTNPQASIIVTKPTDTVTWGTIAHSAAITYGCGDTKGMIDISYNSPLVSIAGGNVSESTDAAPKWYFKLSATSGQTYTFPSTSKTLAAADGSNASGAWSISIPWANTNHPDTFPPTIGTTSTTAMAGNTTVNQVKQSSSSLQNKWRKVILGYSEYTASNTAVGDAVTNVTYMAQDVAVQPYTGAMRANSYKVTDNVTLQWNSTDSSLDFVFA